LRTHIVSEDKETHKAEETHEAKESQEEVPSDPKNDS
jgi:hypothetical protein